MVGGLTFATVMIVYVPVFYVVIEKFRERKAKITPTDTQAQAQAES